MVIIMERKIRKFGILWLALIFIAGAFSARGTGSPVEETDYNMIIDDPSADSYGLTPDSGVAADAAILKVTSGKDGGNIILTMKVSGSVYIEGTTYTTGYQFNIDINGDNAYDWLATVTSNKNYQGTNAQLQDDFMLLHYLNNATTVGNDTVKVQFPLSYITDTDTVDSWNIYGTVSVVKTGTMISYVDTAPDEGFGSGGGNGGNGGDDNDLDDDGMPNDWEDAYGFDKNDPTDADEDYDNDGYTNLEEYYEGTDPTDPNSVPQTSNGDDNEHPSKQTPTDETIDIKITEAKFSEEKDGDILNVNILIKGTTSGVDHCAVMFIYHFKDGTSEDDYAWMGEYNMKDDPVIKAEMEKQGFTDSYLKDTSSGDWKSWELKIAGALNMSGQNDDSGPEADYVEVYVRAYSDANENNWNQAKKEVDVNAGSSGNGDDDDDDGGGFLPGFEAIFVMVSFALATAIAAAARRNNK
jgi:hypothetical protein